ncbi:putative conserved mitochondrial protein [Venustampulla echinocandica]|uniref:Putative conserved mitochondrial protein n=1 Tax=Venustampulla echinocandica TaxID=2656787 RepID=A0A370TX52_9HELO|nr:putative conserved mitochondrial protein [Venustampulla echinocandica]RDL40114.1 putative conserved mitochondrial protein [Venustampulla echinocandica]
MSKLSPSLKALVSAAFARPNTLPASPQIRTVYERLRQQAAAKHVGLPAWLTLSTAATVTMNSPEALAQLYNLATSSSKDKAQSVQTAELMREVGLKCMGLNGIPRTINCLGAFRASLPNDIVSSLSTKPTRVPSVDNINTITTRGHNLWKSIYNPFDEKLVAKLAESHPDLPVFILNHGYGALFSDPAELGHASGAKVGRVLTSIAAVACLRAQTGVGPQVTSHIFGLRKAFEDGTYKAPGEFEVEGGEWLATDDGNIWILKSVDSIVEALSEGTGTTFAPGTVKSNL